MGAERKYVLTKLAPGDYLLPSNDGRRLYRLRLYTEGPSTGLDWPADRDVWGIWEWQGEIGPGARLDLDDLDQWEFCEGLLDTRKEAINAALRLGDSDA